MSHDARHAPRVRNLQSLQLQLIRLCFLISGIALSFSVLSYHSSSPVFLNRYSLSIIILELAMVCIYCLILIAVPRIFQHAIQSASVTSGLLWISAAPLMLSLVQWLPDLILPTFAWEAYTALMRAAVPMMAIPVIMAWPILRSRPRVGIPLTLLATLTTIQLVSARKPYWGMWLLFAATIVLTYITITRKLTQGNFRYRELLANLMLSLAMTLGLLLILDAGLKLFYAQPDAFTVTLSNQNWQKRYWHPINSLGYRDYEWTPDDARDRTTILIIGDSFAAGNGIERIEDRYSSILNNLLGESYIVAVAAQPGWATPAEFRALQEYPIEPDIVILSYFVNDIEVAMIQAEGPSALPYPLPGLYSPVSRSHLLNFIYYRIRRSTSLNLDEDYVTTLIRMYQNEEAWHLHTLELQDIIGWTQARQIPLMVLIFPHPADVQNTRPAADQVAEFFAMQDITVVNLSDTFENRPPSELMVSAFDWHTNEAAQVEIAQLLHEQILQISATPQSTDD